uniref:Uncharacterized protein n=1 Tax=Rhizophora mucronata TaxID=61149 RepID=A0A2P2LIS4_RHIMU
MTITLLFFSNSLFPFSLPRFPSSEQEDELLEECRAAGIPVPRGKFCLFVLLGGTGFKGLAMKRSPSHFQSFKSHCELLFPITRKSAGPTLYRPRASPPNLASMKITQKIQNFPTNPTVNFSKIIIT